MMKQRDGGWEAVVVWDGVGPKPIDDKKIIQICLPRQGGARNHALPLVNTEWVAFLDAADRVTSDFVYKVGLYSDNADVIVFRALSGEEPVPRLDSNKICEKMWPSFACRTKFLLDNDIVFSDKECAVYQLLLDCQNKGAKFTFVPSVVYLVRP